jgi:hypothetical protein
MLDLQPMDGNGKTQLNQKLGSFGKVDPGPNAYFVPALQNASSILQKDNTSQNRKYIVLVTDAVALSADADPCPASQGQQFHNWFCTAGALEQQGIHIILLGFTKPGDEPKLVPTKNYLEQHGGTVLQIEDGDNVAQSLAQTYTELLTRTHPNIFSAVFNGTPSSVQIAPSDKLTDLTFVSVGATGTSLADIQTPTGEHIAGKNGNGSTSTVGRGYWLETISNGSVDGTWHLQAGSITPNQTLVIGVSEGKFVLLNPAPADPNSDIGIRYVAPDEPVVLRARVTKADNTPPIGISFTVNPDSSNAVKFSRDGLPVTEIPDSQEADITALLRPTSTDFLTVGLGEALANTTYFLKSFPIAIRHELASKDIQLQVPASHLLKRNEGVPISAQGTATTVPQSLSLFAQQPNTNSWDLIARNTTDGLAVSGSFPPQQGCKVQYTIMAIEEVKGSLGTNQSQFDYLALTQSPYQSNIEQGTQGNANFLSSPYLGWWWWSSQVTWQLQFSNTVCTPQDIALSVAFQDGTPHPTANILSGASTTLLANKPHTLSVTANLGPCSPDIWHDRTMNLQLTATTNLHEGNDFTLVGPGKQPTIICPSVLTNAGRHWYITIAILILLSILVVRAPQLLILPFVPPVHLTGEIAVDIEEPSVVAEKGGSITSALTSVYVDPTILHIPRYRVPVHTGPWYLERHETSTDVSYSLEARESSESVLIFSMEHDAGGNYVGVVPTRHATGDHLPVFRSGRPVGSTPERFDDEPIMIGNDLISPHLKISSAQ